MRDSRPGAFHKMRWVAAAWLAIWVPAYASVWGWKNFLHLCDIAVVLTCAGIWFGSPLLLSSQAVSSILADLLWDFDASSRPLTGRHLVAGTEYMWQAQFPLGVQLLSLFHVVWPVVLVASLRCVGYDRRGLSLQTGIAACVLLASRLLGPADNLNFAFRDPIWGRSFGPAPIHLALVLAGIVVLTYLSAHFVLSRALPPR